MTSNSLPSAHELKHPLYLDVPMMVSFLAYIENGIAWEQEETRSERDAKAMGGKLSAGIMASLSSLFRAKVDAGLDTNMSEENATGSRTLRHHTAASLFNALYDYLNEDGKLPVIEGVDHIEELEAGTVVEVSGEYVGNSFEEFISFADSFIPYYFDQTEDPEPTPSAKSGQSKRKTRSRSPNLPNPEVIAEQLASAMKEAVAQSQKATNAAVVKIIKRLNEDIRKSPVHDLVLRTAGGLPVILTVSSQFFTEETNEFLRAGEFRAIGKVTRVLRTGRSVNLARRTVLRAASGDDLASMFKGELQNQLLGDSEPTISGPALQLLPMAIYI